MVNKITKLCTKFKQIYILLNYFKSGLGHNLFSSIISFAKNNSSSWGWLCVSHINY